MPSGVFHLTAESSFTKTPLVDCGVCAKTNAGIHVKLKNANFNNEI
jgi:hypothetical protein